MNNPWCSIFTAALFSAALVAPVVATAHPKQYAPPGAVKCKELATNPLNGLAGNPFVKAVNSGVVTAGSETGLSVDYCQVNITYGTNPDQNINIRVGLPLNSVDGGTGGVQGAWNGRTQGIGGGGCTGSVNVVGPVNAGYVGSGNDTGHAGGDCEPAVNTDGTYNYQFINDFIRNGMKAQVLFMKSVAKSYYGMRPAYNYWNGCSTGGRQGYVIAQELGTQLDGILANAPAMYWTRFQTAQMWGQIAMKDLVGHPIDEAKLNQASASAVAACDANDGVVDGIIDDPRTCTFSATANICGAPTAPASNCLTPDEAQAIDRIWDGPRNSRGNKIWFGLDRGTQLGGACIPGLPFCFSLNGTFPFPLGVTQFHWDEHDRNFDWTTVSLDGYPQVAQDGSRNIADLTDTFGNLDTFRRSGGKMITIVGGNDQLIMPRGVINYYRQMASRYGHGRPDFKRLQRFYRLFRAPGVGHCGGGGAGAWPRNGADFEALVDWVEHGVAPTKVIGASAPPAPAITRPLCPYPQRAIYNGSGDQSDTSSYHCGGNLETTRTVCNDVLVKYKHEANGHLDYSGMGVNRHECREINEHDNGY